MIGQEELSRKKMALFFTKGMSLKNWDEAGILGREITFYNELSRYLAKLYFLTYGDREDLQYQEKLAKNIEVLPILADIQKNGNKSRLRSILRDVSFLRTHQLKGAEVALRWKKERQIPLFVRMGYIRSFHHRWESRNPLSNWWVFHREKKILRECDAILCTSQAGILHAKRLCGTDSKPIGWIPNYVDTDLFRPMNIEKKRRSLIFVGRLVPQKNLLVLLKAIQGIPCSVTIVGDGPLREKMLSFVHQSKIVLEYRPKVTNENLPSLLNQHEIFILPSLYEGMPKALLEAMACGLCVVGSDIDGIRDLIWDKVNGRLCSTAPKVIREVLIELLGDSSSIEKYGRRARDAVQQKFNLLQVAQKELDFYRNAFSF